MKCRLFFEGVRDLGLGISKRVVPGFLITSAIAMTAATVSTATLRAAEPETVMVTLHVKAGLEAEAARVIAHHWETARGLNLVIDAPHVTLRGSEEGDRTYFVEVFTWRDANIPDNAPAAIQAIWKDMNAVVEPRGGRPGLHFTEMSLVGSAPTNK